MTNEECIYNKIGERFRQERIENGLTQADIAFKLSTTDSVVSRIETGDMALSYTLLEGVYKCTAMDADYIVLGKKHIKSPFEEIILDCKKNKQRAFSNFIMTIIDMQIGENSVLVENGRIDYWYNVNMLKIPEISEMNKECAGEIFNSVMKGKGYTTDEMAKIMGIRKRRCDYIVNTGRMNVYELYLFNEHFGFNPTFMLDCKLENMEFVTETWYTLNEEKRRKIWEMITLQLNNL